MIGLARGLWLLVTGQLCELIGHEWSWVLAAALGERRPVCERCQRVAGE